MNGLLCALCWQDVDLFELADWNGEPAHKTCADAAQAAWDEAADTIASEHAKHDDRLGRRYRLAS